MKQFNTIVVSPVNTSVLENNSILVLNPNMKFSDRLKQARKHAKLSQEELALAVGCSQGAVSKIERGDQEESALVVKFAVACGVNPVWLDTGNGEMVATELNLSPQMQTHIKVLQQLPDYAVEEVIRDAIKTSELIEKAQANPTKPKKSGPSM